MKAKEVSAGERGKGIGRGYGLLIAASSLALLWTLAFLKGRVESDLEH